MGWHIAHVTASRNGHADQSARAARARAGDRFVTRGERTGSREPANISTTGRSLSAPTEHSLVRSCRVARWAPSIRGVHRGDAPLRPIVRPVVTQSRLPCAARATQHRLSDSRHCEPRTSAVYGTGGTDTVARGGYGQARRRTLPPDPTPPPGHVSWLPPRSETPREQNDVRPHARGEQHALSVIDESGVGSGLEVGCQATATSVPHEAIILNGSSVVKH
jgi:hypothetical protein